MYQTNRIVDIKLVASGSEPFDVTEAKLHLKIDFTDDDAYITDLITACRRAVESYTGVSMITKTITMTADLFCEMELPYGPINALTTVKIRTGTDTGGMAIYETLSGDQYTTDGELYKVFQSGRTGRHVITYTVLAETAEDLVLAVKTELAFRYEHRGDELQTNRGGASGETQVMQAVRIGVCQAAQALANPYRRMSWT